MNNAASERAYLFRLQVAAVGGLLAGCAYLALGLGARGKSGGATRATLYAGLHATSVAVPIALDIFAIKFLAFQPTPPWWRLSLLTSTVAMLGVAGLLPTRWGIVDGAKGLLRRIDRAARDGANGVKEQVGEQLERLRAQLPAALGGRRQQQQQQPVKKKKESDPAAAAAPSAEPSSEAAPLAGGSKVKGAEGLHRRAVKEDLAPDVPAAEPHDVIRPEL